MSYRNLVSSFVLVALAACAHSRIANTQVADTPENREVYDLVQKALGALTQRDANTLLSLISTRYFEDNATPQPDDDYGYEQLKELLPRSLEATQEVFVDTQIQGIVVEGERARVDIRYASRTRLLLPAGSTWDSHREFNRIELERENGAWKIVRGL